MDSQELRSEFVAAAAGQPGRRPRQPVPGRARRPCAAGATWTTRPAVLTGPATAAGSPATPIRRSRPADASGMVPVRLHNHPLTASAALVWSADLPRPLQQMLFETTDSLTAPAPPRPAELVS